MPSNLITENLLNDITSFSNIQKTTKARHPAEIIATQRTKTGGGVWVMGHKYAVLWVGLHLSFCVDPF